MSNSITISVIGDVKNLVSGVDTVNGKLGKLGGVARTAGKAMAAGLAVAGAAFVAWGVDSAKSLIRIEQINAQTAQAIKSTGGAAGVTATHVENLAGRLENLTATEAETTQQNANLLLTFTNVRNEAGKGNAVFDRTVSTFVDMQRAVPSASMTQLGKALNDPIKGISALSRVGVTFNEQQKDQIATLVKSGDTLKAQKIILGELDKEFGGSGAAFAKTTAGKIELAKHAFGTLGETIFAKVLPPLGDLAVAATKGLAWLDTKGPQIAAFGQQVGAAVLPTLKAIGLALLDVGRFLVTTAIPALVNFGQTVATAVGPYLIQTAVVVQTRILPALASFGQFLTTNVVPALVSVGQFVTGTVLPALGRFYTFLATKVAPVVLEVAQKVGNSLKPVLTQLFATIQGQVIPAVLKIAAKFEEWRPTIEKVTVVVLKIIGKVLEFAAAIVGKVLPPAIRFAGFLIGTLVPAVLANISALAKIIGKVIEVGTAFVNAIKDVAKFVAAVQQKIADAVRFVAGIPGKVVSALGDVGRILYDAGTKIIGGLIQGIQDKLGDLKGALGGVTSLIPDWKGPPKKDAVLLRPAGRLIMQGLIDGFSDGLDGVKATLTKITDRITKTVEARIKDDKRAAAVTKSVLAGLRDQFSELTKVGRAQDALAAKVTKAADAYKTARSAMADYAKSIRQMVTDTGNITSLVTPEDGQPITGASLVTSLLDKIAQAQRFQSLIAQLTRDHLNATSLKQLLDAGVSGGLATAEALASGGSALISQINTLTGILDTTGANLGNSASQTFYGAGVDAAKGLLDGLKSQTKPLQKIAHDLGAALVEAINDALGGKRKGKGKTSLADVAAGINDRLALGLADTHASNRSRIDPDAFERATSAKANGATLDQLLDVLRQIEARTRETRDATEAVPDGVGKAVSGAQVAGLKTGKVVRP